MHTLSTQELLDKLGLKSSRTLRHWRSLGLIRSPKIVAHPDGRGRTAQWPASVVAQCLAVREKLQRGESLEEIASKPNRAYRFGEDWERRARQLALLHLRDGVLKSLRRLGRELVSSLSPELITRSDLATALRLVSQGKTPVLVFLRDHAMVVAEDELGQLRSPCHEQPNLCVLLWIGPFLAPNDQYPDTSPQ